MMRDTNKGLSEKQAAMRLKEYGENVVDGRRDLSLALLFFGQYKNTITLILLFASLFAFFIREILDAVFILVILVVNGFFGFIQEYRAQKTVEKLQNLVVPMVSVIRDGKEKKVRASSLVPGETVIVREGDRIPADGSLLSDSLLEVDESIFTGEAIAAEKEKDAHLLAGSYIVRGNGVMSVGSTGALTKLGQIAQEIEEIKKPKTPLVMDLERLARKLAFGAIGLSLLLIPVGIWQNRSLSELVITVISMAVAVIPEGLALVVTVALAVGAYRLTKENVITRKMASIETLGSTNIILTDKTGTLTQNKMSVKKHYVPTQTEFRHLLRACVVGNSASITQKLGSDEPEVIGDKTDGAFLLFAHQHVEDIEKYVLEGNILSQTPFNPETKTIETVWKKHGDGEYLFVRGAPESIFSLLTSKSKKKAKDEFDKFTKEGLRVIAFAHQQKGKKGFALTGLLALYDPPRKEAGIAVERALQAGIRVVMVTGDNPKTAVSIAQEIGLFQAGDLVMTTDELEKLSEEELRQSLPRIRIFARMKPHDKLRLVKAYKSAGFIVAVTGDGVNDALALTEAHIGVAMGRSGTDVAKEAADMVITDDNLYTIVRAVEEGRGIYANITKVVIYLVSSNVAEFLLVFVGILLGFPIPLSPTQILWINLISDGLPALALATDKKRDSVLLQKPRNIKEQILSKPRAFLMAKIALPFAFIMLAMYFLLLQYYPAELARFILFNIFVIGELGIVFIVRGGVRPFNKMLFITVAFAVLLQVIIFFSPLLRRILS